MLNGRFDRRQAMPLGGMGQVWLAVDTVLADRTVALKMLRPEFAQDPGHV